MLGIKAALADELGQHTDGQNDETGSDDAATEIPDNLDNFDENAMAEAADALIDGAQADKDPAAAEAAADDEAEVQSDATKAEEASKPSDAETEKPAEAEKPKHEAFQARIDELTARAKGAEEQLQAAQEQLASYRARDQGELTPDVLDHVETPEELSKAEARYNALVQWAIRNPDGGKLGDREYTAEEVRDLHANVHTLVTEAVPRRREYLGRKQQAEAEAINFYPWLKDTSKGAGAMVRTAIEQTPAIRRMPNYRLAVADAIVGQALRMQGIQLNDTLLARLAAEAKASSSKPKAGAKPQVQGQPKPPSAPARAGVLPPRLSPRAAAAKASGNRLRQSDGAEDDLAASIANKL